MNNYTVYCHINKYNNKIYIGITGQDPKKRWGNGKGYKNSFFFNAIQKYGWDNFEHKILYTNLSKLDAELIEIDLIHYYKSINKSYNVANGGNVTTGLKMSEQARKNISQGHIGLKRSDSFKEKIRVANKNRSDEIKRKLIDSNKRPIIQLSLDGVFIKEYESIKDAELQLGICHQNISKCCKNIYKTAGGYKWQYKQ